MTPTTDELNAIWSPLFRTKVTQTGDGPHVACFKTTPTYTRGTWYVNQQVYVSHTGTHTPCNTVEDFRTLAVHDCNTRKPPKGKKPNTPKPHTKVHLDKKQRGHKHKR